MVEDQFVIDKTPTKKEDGSDVPRYSVSRKSVELAKAEKVVHQKDRPQFMYNPCWNCGKKTHNIRDCQVENNIITVEWYKELHLLMKTQNTKTFSKGTGRYHQCETISNDSTLKIGELSPTLRRIMGLRERDLPPYIYRLRKHGYPKAWLKRATVKPSGLNLYDAHGNEVAEPGAEDGEVFDEEDRLRYDLKKLIKFPGFNAPAPDGVVDDYLNKKAPPYSENQSLENMLAELQGKAVPEYKLIKEKCNISTSINNQKSETFDARMDTFDARMDIDNQDDSFVAGKGPIADTCFIPPLPREPNATSSSESASSAANTETFSQVLQDSVPVSNTTPIEDGLGRVLTSTEGTPILKSKSGYTRLPPAENFSKDICDLINFENLPESTGRFEKMRGILKKVKRILKMNVDS